MSSIRIRFEPSGFEVDAESGEAIMDITDARVRVVALAPVSHAIADPNGRLRPQHQTLEVCFDRFAQELEVVVIQEHR